MTSASAQSIATRFPLPINCVGIDTDDGKRLLAEAVRNGQASIYSNIVAHFPPQDRIGLCGLATLAAINALDVDPPARMGDGSSVWKWYSESTIDCTVVSFDKIRRYGMTLMEFTCLALTNRLSVSTVHADNGDRGLKAFRQHLIESVQSCGVVVTANYNRRVLGQVGGGHFSPLAAYHAATDSVLLMEVNRHKYPPHWVSLKDLWSSMLAIDSSSGKSRGYSLLSLRHNFRPLMYLRLPPYIGASFDHAIWKQIDAWMKYLSDYDVSRILSIDDVVLQFATLIPLLAESTFNALLSLESPPAVAHLRDVVASDLKMLQVHQMLKASQKSADPLLVTFCFISWPFHIDNSPMGLWLLNYCDNVAAGFKSDTRHELRAIRLQLEVAIKLRLHTNASIETLCAIGDIN